MVVPSGEGEESPQPTDLPTKHADACGVPECLETGLADALHRRTDAAGYAHASGPTPLVVR